MATRTEKQPESKQDRATLTIPRALYKSLKAMADREHRSVSGQVAHLVDRAREQETAQ